MIRWILSWFGLALPPWLGPALVLGSIVVAGGAGYLEGRIHGAERCEAAALRLKVKNMQRDIDNEKAAGADADRLAKALTAANDQLTKENEAYERELAARPDGRCALTPDDLRRLH